jgi:hypothetical protein
MATSKFNTHQMPIISINYIAKWQLKSAPNYWFTKCQKCYNTKSGKLIKQVMKGSTIGYVISSKFVSISNIKKDLELIPKTITPF